MNIVSMETGGGMEDESEHEYKCTLCQEPGGYGWGEKDYCIDCWPGYNLCKQCGDYRVEHIGDYCEGECHCVCPSFEEGSTERIVNSKEFAALVKIWEAGK